MALPTNEALLARRRAAYNQIQGPREGDVVLFPDGREERIVNDMNKYGIDSVQTYPGGSFYLGHGYVEHSGALNPGFPKKRLKPTPITEMRTFWFFNNDVPRAHNGHYFQMRVRVYRYEED